LYKAHISENLAVGSTVIILNATDADDGINAEIEYSLRSKGQDQVLNQFQIDSKTGAILVKVLQKALDREHDSVIKLTLTAVDGGNPSQSGTSQIVITVLDINDNHPVFSRSLYKIQIPENLPTGSTVITLNATDADEGLNSEIEYSLRKKGQDHVLDIFQIDYKTGAILVKENNAFEIRVQASDGASSPLTSHAKLLIEVVDVNDNAPEISVTSLLNSVKEDASIGTAIALVSVLDKDGGKNGMVNCKISNNVPFKLETNYKNYYSLVVDGPLDRETSSQYNISITATDEGSPPLSSTSVVNVHVSDVNDNKPLFTESIINVYVKENSPVGAVLKTVSAIDADIDQNGQVSYSFLHNNKSVSAELVLQKPLDREKQPVIKLTLTAVDGGTPPKSGTSQLIINVLDVNDNVPIFTKPLYKTSVAENAPLGTSVITVTAADDDEGPNGEISYSLSSKDQDHVLNLFQIDEHTGLLTVKGKIDYEEHPAFEIRVQAGDKGFPPMTAQCKVLIEVVDLNDNTPEISVTTLTNTVKEDAKIGTAIALVSVLDRDGGKNGIVHLNGELDRESDSYYNVTITAKDDGIPALTSTRDLTVYISDVNDNSPSFSETLLNVYVKENSPVGHVIKRVSALDADTAENAQVSYSIAESNSHVLPLSTMININSDTGEIISLQSFNYEELKTFQFKVQATDSGVPPLSSNVTVNVLILDENDNNPTILAPYSEHGSVNSESIPYSAEAGYFVAKIRAVDDIATAVFVAPTKRKENRLFICCLHPECFFAAFRCEYLLCLRRKE
uniref:Cadherin domain-containing protein n=1 Tax=Stegastes partitus TaxID=144197 RepID=A0A3B5AMI9_9TELE